MGDVSLRGRGVVRKKFKKGGLSRRGFLGMIAATAAAPDLVKGLKKQKKIIKPKNIPKKGSGLSRQELMDKVNNKTATDLEKQELEMIEEMDILP
jgi:calcineurin-like phosphoesterase